MLQSQSRPIHPMIPALCVLLAALAWQAGARSSNTARPPATPTATATVDIVTIFDQLKERETRESELEGRKAKSQQQLDDVKNQLRTITEDLKMLDRSTDEYKNKIREAMEMQAIIKARGEALNQILSIDRGNIIREMYTKVSDAVRRIAEREGYDTVLFDDSLFPIPEDVPYNDVFRAIVTKSVIYHHPATDITDQVVKLMNSEFTVP